MLRFGSERSAGNIRRLIMDSAPLLAALSALKSCQHCEASGQLIVKNLVEWARLSRLKNTVARFLWGEEKVG